ncbi:phage tail protein [Vibrio cholerae]
MSKTYSTIPTRIGAAKLRNASILNTTVKIVKVAFGDGGGSEYEPTGEETSLKRQTYFTVPNYIKEEGSSPTWVEMEVVIPHNVGGWYLREFCCYDEDDDLIFIGNLPESYKPSGDAGVIKDLVFEMVYDAVAANVVSLKIDANVVIATRKFVEDQFKLHKQENNPHPQYPLASYAQFLAYDPVRIYSAGEVCYTKDAENGELSYWQWYSNVESLSGKSPLDIANRHTGWQDNTKPFYWIPYTGDQVGMPFFWLAEEAPEWAVMEINVDLPIAVYWRLARRYPDLVNGNVINTGEIRDEFLRVWDNGRGRTANRELNSTQAPTQIPFITVHNTGVASRHLVTPPIGSWSDTLFPQNSEEKITAPSGAYYQGTVSSASSGANGLISYATYPRNTARAMAIAI